MARLFSKRIQGVSIPLGKPTLAWVFEISVGLFLADLELFRRIRAVLVPRAELLERFLELVAGTDRGRQPRRQKD